MVLPPLRKLVQPDLMHQARLMEQQRQASSLMAVVVVHPLARPQVAKHWWCPPLQAFPLAELAAPEAGQQAQQRVRRPRQGPDAPVVCPGHQLTVEFAGANVVAEDFE